MRITVKLKYALLKVYLTYNGEKHED
jgi:hypothetical protein